jgi:undecaprenyl-diphosphatase
MSLLQIAVLAALQGLTEVLPISRSGHEVVARVWLDTGAQAASLEGLLHLGTALALAAVARRRLLAAVGDGVRAIARPALFVSSPAAHDAAVVAVATVVSLATSALVAPHVEMWSESATATGIGLLVTGASLASTSQIPRAPFGRTPQRVPAVQGAVLVGLAHGLAIFPGASRVGAALTLLLWLGVRPGRALDLAFLVTVPSLLLAFAHAAGSHPSGLATPTLVLGLVLAFVSAALGSEVVRSLAERRKLATLALWTIPLGLATLAYAHALPLSS